MSDLVPEFWDFLFRDTCSVFLRTPGCALESSAKVRVTFKGHRDHTWSEQDRPVSLLTERGRKVSFE